MKTIAYLTIAFSACLATSLGWYAYHKTVLDQNANIAYEQRIDTLYKRALYERQVTAIEQIARELDCQDITEPTVIEIKE
jgi:hypothetical protein